MICPKETYVMVALPIPYYMTPNLNCIYGNFDILPKV